MMIRMQKYDEFMNDIQEDLRREKVEKYWKKYGKQALAVMSVVLVTAIGHTLYKNHQTKLTLKTSDQFVAAQNFMAQGNIKDALVILEDLSVNAPGAYLMLSQFAKAGALLQQGGRDNQEQAIAILKQIENTKGVDAVYRDLAEILGYIQKVDLLKSSDKDLDNIRLRLDQLITSKGPWYPIALELKGVALFKVGAYKQAAEVFVLLIQDKQIPDAMKMRAQLMTQTLATKLNTSKNK